ncbi:DUF1450 domain-containing protein [Metabacillus malikii]|uniref:Uncharacterized protein YuzB (UPF0349 family) n=1 Tax=Metabacillus malikii TaxID=1504265 RepID=A0ABT9ZKM1_9BACI|nr:DUF1450 domain-containing protein [Metabacillus malikii]MDQ0232083.1 uncharacterized protein YuzB (UPF0349 family) [Metabacillus malikii]
MNVLGKWFSKKEKLKIEFCEKNLDRFYSEEDFVQFSTLFNDKRIEYKEYQCQSKCKECKKSPYAIVNGEMITCESPLELLGTLKKMNK